MNRIQTLPRTTAAIRYRQREQLTGGVVVLNKGIPTTWLPSMPPAKDWQEGIEAVDADGNEWSAQGGNEDGAEFWRQLNG
ncbi:hypothetical protein [Marinobacterium stanieri]|uniref:Uncharacterized protein n=1 Tax=Marinobacterium stanieri TaxID=49186 RepID=A0A1N6QD72_9GAMM|nr:hypothetical protein [Marinobacterium stanieri]SIQ14455.1 hypothetical protein SAMN05421647_102425 [Marinobacterium stanieri]